MEQERISSEHLAKVICEIDMRLPSLNEYINVCRANRFQASKFKHNVESEIGLYIARLPRFHHPVKVHFHWIEPNKRRDLDNIAFAKKFILDALIECGKLKDDNRRFVTGFTDTFEYAKKPKIILTFEEDKDEPQKSEG